MATINLLDRSVYNKIAAGEVIERPASVVKELVENSIDAGATDVTVRISGGGIEHIRVIDNGCGIEPDQVERAFLPHATSKICTSNDLFEISTLGFRGEALASIASVSMVTMQTKTIENEFGKKIEIRGGDIISIEDIGISTGTDIEVNNLFFNVPVRAKFLKKPKSEEGEITNLIHRMILANPTVSFRYFIDGKLIIQTSGKGLDDAIFAIYGGEAIRNSFKVDLERNSIKLFGYIGKHDYTKANRTYQTIILNGRYIVNQTISTAIFNAYSPFLMKRNYPFYVLHVTIPTEIVDVNVHPNKADVRFSDNNLIFGSIYKMILSVLNSSMEVVSVQKEEQPILPAFENPFIFENEVKVRTKSEPIRDELFNFAKESIFRREKENDLQANQNIEEVKQESTFYHSGFETPEIFGKLDETILKTGTATLSDSEAKQDVLPIFDHVTILGTLFKTYIVCESNDCCYLIDQHAAHERLLYDQLRKQYEARTTTKQLLLVPYILTLNPTEYHFVMEKATAFQMIGFDLEPFGDTTIKVNAIPADLANLNIERYFSEVLSNLEYYEIDDVLTIVSEKLMQTACKNAVKAGDSLREADISFMISQIKSGLTLKCPHGRPILVQLEKKEIEKWFKRIV